MLTQIVWEFFKDGDKKKNSVNKFEKKKLPQIKTEYDFFLKK